jgi:hypothetical protein
MIGYEPTNDGSLLGLNVGIRTGFIAARRKNDETTQNKYQTGSACLIEIAFHHFVQNFCRFHFFPPQQVAPQSSMASPTQFTSNGAAQQNGSIPQTQDSTSSSVQPGFSPTEQQLLSAGSFSAISGSLKG